LDNIWNHQTHPSFSEAERVALDFSVAASTIPNRVDVALHQRLHEHWSDQEIVELLGVISLFGYLNRWNDSMATTLEEDSITSGRSLLGHKGWEIGKHK
jgi:alkylhydroperoxidase family enzyme